MKNIPPSLKKNKKKNGGLESAKGGIQSANLKTRNHFAKDFFAVMLNLWTYVYEHV